MPHCYGKLTCHIPAEVRIPPLPPSPQPKPVLNLATVEGCKVELTYVCYVKTDRLGIVPATSQSHIQRPTAAPPHNTV